MLTADQFVAHRGYTACYPENSLAGICAAIEAGAKHIEVDVQFSKDGVPILYHDTHLERISGCEGRIEELEASDLQKRPANEPDRLGGKFDHITIALLKDLIPYITANCDAHFYIELKVEAAISFGVDFCLQTIRDTLESCLEQITLISFDPLAVEHAKAKFDFPSVGIVLHEWPSRNNMIAASLSDIAFISQRHIPEDEKITADCPIVIYEIADPKVALTLLQRGAAKIETYAIADLLQALCDD